MSIEAGNGQPLGIGYVNPNSLICEAKREGQRMGQISSACVIWAGPDGSYTDMQWWYAADYVFDKAEHKAMWQKMLKLTPEDDERIERRATERRQEAARRALEIQQRSATAGATAEIAG